MIDPATTEEVENTWFHAGDVAAQAIWDIANRAKDKADERADSMRVHNGMTLDEFLAQK